MAGCLAVARLAVVRLAVWLPGCLSVCPVCVERGIRWDTGVVGVAGGRRDSPYLTGDRQLIVLPRVASIHSAT
jgi:hypothetical protein